MKETKLLSYRLHERDKKSYKRLKISVNEGNEQWAVDLAKMNDLARYDSNFKYWLACIDVHLRYVFLELLQNKTSE